MNFNEYLARKLKYCHAQWFLLYLKTAYQVFIMLHILNLIHHFAVHN